MKPRTLTAVALGLLLAACGSDEGGAGESGASVRPAQSTPATMTSDPVARRPADVALRYMRAVVDKDWAAACQTRTRREREDLARTGGSCARAFEIIFRGKATELFSAVEPGDVRIKGDLAGIDLVQPGHTRPALVLAAVRENGEWRLEDMDESKVP
jgi:hypothetical protein